MIPNEIIISGLAAIRSVAIDGKWIEQGDYNWGYTGGEQPKNLAYNILKKYIQDEKMILRYLMAFKNSIIGFLPQGNFKAKIHLKKWVEAYDGNGKSYHAFDFLDIHTGVNYISKFIDFPNLPYQTGIFGKDTMEYKILKKLQDTNEWIHYENYIREATTRKEFKAGTMEEITGSITYDEFLNSFVYKNGLGGINTTGNKYERP